MPEYDRFWDVHLTDDEGLYDFRVAMNEMATYQATERRKPGLTDQQEFFIKRNILLDKAQLLEKDFKKDQLPKGKGYVATMAKLSDIEKTVEAEKFRNMVEWVNTTTLDGANLRGKLRLSCHGGQDGKLSMSNIQTNARNVGEWLVANGLKNNGLLLSGIQNNKGLMTITLSTCRAAMSGLNPSTKNDEAISESSIAQVADALTGKGVFGIAVIGANELLFAGGGDARELKVPEGGGWGKIESNQGTKSSVFFSVSVPNGWKIQPLKVLAPDGFQARPNNKNTPTHANGGWKIHSNVDSNSIVTVPKLSGWLVLPEEGPFLTTILYPLGWHGDDIRRRLVTEEKYSLRKHKGWNADTFPKTSPHDCEGEKDFVIGKSRVRPVCDTRNRLKRNRPANRTQRKRA